jgi:hypothetical protein
MPPLALKKEKPGHRSTNMGSSELLELSEAMPAACTPRLATFAKRRTGCGLLLTACS